jgi:hypothetical protein
MSVGFKQHLRRSASDPLIGSWRVRNGEGAERLNFTKRYTVSMGEEADGGSNSLIGFLISKLGGPAWAGPLLLALIAFGFWIHHEKEDLVDRINSTKTDVSKDLGALKDDFSKDRRETGIDLAKIRHSIEVLASKSPNRDLVNQMLSEKINQRISPLERRLGDLQTKVEQQASLVRVYNPNQLLAVVRSEVGFASVNKKLVSEPRLIDLRNAVLAVPTETPGYWETAQMVVNYTSDVLITTGAVPDPAKVAHPCQGLTSQGSMRAEHNTIAEYTISNCIVDLDTQGFLGVTFQNCLIRSRGGTFVLRNVTFLNCRFLLELPEGPRRQNEKNFLGTLLSAHTLNNVTATNG